MGGEAVTQQTLTDRVSQVLRAQHSEDQPFFSCVGLTLKPRSFQVLKFMLGFFLPLVRKYMSNICILISLSIFPCQIFNGGGESVL